MHNGKSENSKNVQDHVQKAAVRNCKVFIVEDIIIVQVSVKIEKISTSNGRLLGARYQKRCACSNFHRSFQLVFFKFLFSSFRPPWPPNNCLISITHTYPNKKKKFKKKKKKSTAFGVTTFSRRSPQNLHMYKPVSPS